ncbi:low temperature requirement protein A [Agromyces seonyuensis]|uniref:Low temperature requirement protein A n=1 Tax=Agromyces seonyuensis TaxID=2662446 RepID=A0A6I4NVV8_9MICO|nr:low temperature requirement protein A [Agromyces seonyuensis]MWB97252.1 hypothetical protein [Agromyces seonyuensis]
MPAQPRANLLRPTGTPDADRVTYVELFFDLVFVFALTQLGAVLYEQQTLLGAIEGVILLCALWWAWVSTTWLTNWLDPTAVPVRAFVILLAFVVFTASVAIPEAFGERAWVFAVAYTGLQVGRAVFLVLATRAHEPAASREFRQVLSWTLVGSALWIGGAFLPLPAQVACWAAAIGIELLGSILGYPVPGAGRIELAGRDASGPHIAERAALFVLIALGEGLLVTGFELAAAETTPETIVSFVSAFVAAAACWWIYFDHGERVGSEAMEAAEAPARLARTAYTWVHLAIVGGIVLLGVGDKEVLGHPDEQSPPAVVLVLGGPALFLVGTLLFRWVLEHRLVIAQACGLAALVVAAAVSPLLEPVSTGVLGSAVLLATAVGETVERHRRGVRAGG